MFRLCLAAACVAAIGCSGGLLSIDPPEYDLYEAALRQVATGPANDAGGARVVYYVEVDGAGPAGLFARFRGSAPAVEPASGYRKDDATVAAHLVHVQGEVQWQATDRARVFVRSHRADQVLDCGTPWPIPLRKVGGRWVADGP